MLQQMTQRLGHPFPTLQFLAVDLGGVRYPRYQVWRSRSAFASRQALLCYESALRHAEALTDAVEVGWPAG